MKRSYRGEGKVKLQAVRNPLVGVVAVLALAMAFAVPAGAAARSADASGAPIAVDAKKKCKKKKRKCKKRGGGGGGGGATAGYVQGRYSGTYAENNVDLFFNVAGGRVYTGPFDTFYINAPCSEGLSDISTIEPVQAVIGSDGSFSGSGVWAVAAGSPSGFSVPWTLTGHISGTSITNGVFSVGPYTFPFSNKTCSGTTSFTAGWIGAYTL